MWIKVSAAEKESDCWRNAELSGEGDGQFYSYRYSFYSRVINGETEVVRDFGQLIDLTFHS